tara:strand:+ start:65200 stop:66303 length:1104 start_codon:yes stop_codon:yes gene_type:complete
MKVLYAPVGITPTKPLTASHLRGVLLVDAMQKIRSRIDDVTVWHNRRPWDISLQTTQFWGYLDTHFPDHDYSSETDISLGMKYVRASAASFEASAEMLQGYTSGVDSSGYLHPSAQRMLTIWRDVFSSISVDPDIITRSDAFEDSAENVMGRLDKLGILLDQRGQGGCGYIDLTDEGLPLRKIVDADGSANYIVAILRDIWMRAQSFDKTFLVYDSSVERDYILLERVLRLTGVECQRCPFKRVPVNGAVLSSREGGWKGTTAGELLVKLREFSVAAISLGLRMYFLYQLGLRNPTGFDAAQLHRQVEASEKLIGELGNYCNVEMPLAFWQQFRTRSDDIDIYRVLSMIAGKKVSAAEKSALVGCLI